MNSQLYGLLFIVLICALILLGVYLILNIISDFCCKTREKSMINRELFQPTDGCHLELSKHKFDKHDVEDLTRMEKDFKKDFRKFSFSNEVKNNDMEERLKRSIKVAEEEILTDKFYSTDTINGRLASVAEDERKIGVQDEIRRLDLTDAVISEPLKAVLEIENKAKKVEDEMNQFKGGTNNLQFYELNEKYIRLMISLCDIHCDDDYFKKRKNKVLTYIEQCQNLLKSKSLR